ncbi:MAG: hypothetical protein Q9165_008079 [Trypethelium subeluteriae]
MPPRASARRTRPRREVEIREESDADTPESIPTPSRKRRKVNGGNERAQTKTEKQPPKTVKKDEDTQSVDTLEDEDLVEDPEEVQRRKQQELEQQVILHLKVAKYSINAAIECSNEVHERNKTDPHAFAKLAGRTWTYYVKQLETVIGRPYQKPTLNEQQPQDESEAAPNDDPSAQFQVHVDLGPEKHVSRLHARIYFDTDEQRWFIHVIGRNGVRLDDMQLRREQTAPLRSGHVIDIAGTQMLFLLPNELDPPVFDKTILAQIPAENGDEDEEDDDDYGQNKPSHAHPRFGSPRQYASSGMPYHQQSRFSRDSLGQSQGGMTNFGGAAPGYSNPMQYGTPLRSGQSLDYPRPKQSPAYARGVMMESTEDIDYSLDSAKDLKPPHSYAQLIGMAIIQSPEGQLTLANIYEYIRRNYAYYRHGGGGWQNSIRHNLSLNKAFEKVARRTNEPGKGMKWRIVPDSRDEFMRRGFTGSRRGFQQGSSGPNSPAATAGATRSAHEHLMGVIAPGTGGPAETEVRGVKRSPRSATPPINHYPTAYTGPTTAFTPDRGPRRPTNGLIYHGADDSPRLPSSAGSQNNGLPGTRGLPGATSAGSPTARNPNASLYNSDPPEFASANPALFQGGNLVTPHLARHQPRLAPPSTAQVPSHFMPMSSPAPFWKGFTVPLGTSPVKGGGPVGFDSPAPVGGRGAAAIAVGGDVDKDGNGVGLVQGSDDRTGTDEPPRSSSPLGPRGAGATGGAVGDEGDEVVEASPTRTVSRAASQVEVGRGSRVDGGNAMEVREMQREIQREPVARPVGGSAAGLGRRSFEVMPAGRTMEEEEGIDLTR